MEKDTLGKYTVAFGLSVAVVSLLSALLVIAKESNAVLMAWMKAATGHHWLSHGAVVLVLFLAFGLAFAAGLPAASGRPGARHLAAIVAAATLAAGTIIAGFFLRQP